MNNYSPGKAGSTSYPPSRCRVGWSKKKRACGWWTRTPAQ